ncbi:MAG: serine hydrolase domain-containing protein [Ilumatobacteraceae bacterium]
MRTVRRPVMVVCAALLTACGAGSESPLPTLDMEPVQAVAYPGAQWESAPVPAAAGGEAELVAVSEKWFGQDAPAPGVMSVVVAHRGRIVFERTAPGVSTSDAVPSWSVAKSVLGAAVGVAVDRGIVSLEDDSLHPSWPAGDPRSRITVAALLHMASGLDWGENWETGDPVRLFLDPRGAAAFAATKALVAEPGRQFRYSSGDSSLLAGHLSRRLGGQGALERFVRDNVLAPVGIREARFDLDLTGEWTGAAGLNMSPRDFARFGHLFARGGMWNDTRVVPQEWVEYSATVGVPNSTYGAHWWVHTHPVFSAEGLFGQVVMVDPSTTTVVVVTSRTGADFDSGMQLALRLTGLMSLTVEE